MEDSNSDPHNLNSPKTVALRERALARRTFVNDREREAYIALWNSLLISRRKEALANIDLERTEADRLELLRVATAKVPPVAPIAQPKRRHWGLLAVFLGVVIVPVVVSMIYLATMARDQYASTTAFTVRSDETSSATELLGGLTQIVGGGGGAGGNADVLFEFIQSQEMVQRINDRLNLFDHYGAGWKGDPVFSLWPGATIEDLLWFWKRMVRITYDKATGLLMVQVRAGDAQTAQQIASLVVEESEAMINTLNEAARRDSMFSAQQELNAAQARVSQARSALAEFRGRTQILDPIADIQGRMGVLSNLQQQLAEALVEVDLLAQTTADSDPRVRRQERRVEAIEGRIAQERLNFAAQNVTVDNTDYPALLAQYEELQVAQEFAEQTLRAAMTAMDAARSNAERQSLYLATYIRPTLAERSQYPRRIQLVALVAFFGLTIWAIFALVYYSLRDRG